MTNVSVVDENGRKVLTPEVGQPTILEVNFKVGMVDEPKFQILYGKSRRLLESMVAYEIPDSTSWNIEFVPSCAGTHFIQIWLESQEDNQAPSICGKLAVSIEILSFLLVHFSTQSVSGSWKLGKLCRK